MTCFNKEHYKHLKASAKKEGDVFVFTRETSDGEEYNGISVAFRPAIVNTNCRMLEVSVSYCSPEDKFKKKHGKYQALDKLANGECVHLPLAGYLRDTTEHEVGETLLNIFEV